MRVDAINPIIQALYEIISDKNSAPIDIGLLSGLSGTLLFQWQLSQFDPTFVDQSLFEDQLDTLQQNLHRLGSNFSLSNGFSGTGWFLEYLNQSQGADYDPDLCSDIDEILLAAVSGPHWAGEIEMVVGLGGIAIYAARRQRRTNQLLLFDKILGHYERLATHFSDTELAWTQPKQTHFRLDKENPERIEYNLGLAHGIPGIIAALLPAYEIPELQDRVTRLLTQSCDWLLKQAFSGPAPQVSCFPTIADGTYTSRLGWCYGDLTIALTLARVGNRLGIPRYVEVARDVSLKAVHRDAANGWIFDAGLCHGSAGLGLIFDLLASELSLDPLRATAQKWYDFTLELYDRNGLKGFDKYDALEKVHLEKTGFLEGYAGVGLCLLAAVGQDTDWTDCLLLS